MKTLYLIGGPMGVGKTAAGQLLKKKIAGSMFLVGDWCWDMNPFLVTEYAKAMVFHNICYLLKNFLESPDYGTVILAWVMHEQAIVDAIAERVGGKNVRIVKVSLVCREDVLRKRLEKDIKAGLREAGCVERSFKRLRCYKNLDTVKLDTSELTAAMAAEEIAKL